MKPPWRLLKDIGKEVFAFIVERVAGSKPRRMPPPLPPRRDVQDIHIAGDDSPTPKSNPRSQRP